MRRKPLAMRYKNQMEISHQATIPGNKNSSHNGRVIRYNPPAMNSVRSRHVKWLACQVPAASLP